ncbi:MAG: DUF91 domain-containing protein [Oscillatoriales cyanobacterium]|nr:MAG: DUF91 domain-containing protein [Oscillatoriales cyanobacterium]
MIRYQLIQANGQWCFVNESELENFVWDNLQIALGLTPIKRQFSLEGQFIDILAMDEEQNLAIVELKNIEDRHIVQQLTRYFDLVVNSNDSPFELPKFKKVRLIGILPSVHLFSKLDCKYHRLEFELLEFSVLVEDENFYWNLEALNKKIPIVAWTKKEELAVEPPSQSLIRLINKNCQENKIASLLHIRDFLLSSDPRMKEIQERGILMYGNTKSRICVELHIKSKRGSGGLLLLKLPDYTCFSKDRLRLFIVSEDGTKFTNIYWIGTMNFNGGLSFEQMVEWLGNIAESRNAEAQIAYSRYQEVIASGKTLKSLIQVAITYWQERL